MLGSDATVMHTTRERGRALGLVVALLCPWVGACASPEPDVVATQQSQRPDGGFHDLAKVHACRAGSYQGTFSSVAGADAATISTLKGLISFELIEEPSGEFLRVNNGEKLQGASEQGDSFSADIDSDNSGCKEGVFTVNLKNGVYVPAGSVAQYTFYGNVNGVYLATMVNGQHFEGFLGAWEAFWPLDPNNPIARGQWSATLAAASP